MVKTARANMVARGGDGNDDSVLRELWQGGV